MKTFIPYLTGKSFLINAINSTGKYKKDIIVIDNSLDLDPDEAAFQNVTIIKPPTPLRFTDTMNFIQKIAKDNNPDEPFLFMHADAEVTPEVCSPKIKKKLLDHAVTQAMPIIKK